MASGYDISASASLASGSGTGAVKFGNVNIGSGVGGSASSFPTWLIWVIGAGAAAFLAWKLLRKKK